MRRRKLSFDRPSKERFDREHAPEDMIFAHTNPREVTLDGRALARQKELISFAHEHGCEVLISCHTFVPMRAEELLCLARHLESKGPDVIKIVGAADTAEELAEAFRTLDWRMDALDGGRPGE